MKANAIELADVPREQRGTHERYAYIRDLFEELKTRLARIPRHAQRRAVEEPPVGNS
jgi:hypothetical protein